MQILDFHVHFFSRPYFEALAAQSPLPGTVAEKLARVAEKAGLEIPGPDLAAHRARWLAELDKNDVERMACFSSAPEETAAVAEACAGSDGRLVPFALVNPKVEGTAERVAKLIEEKGFRGVLLFPALHHYKISESVCEPLLKVLAERKAVAYVHCGLLIVKLRDLLQLPRTIDIQYANPIELVAAANKFPDARLVVPHFGAGFFREALFAGAQCPNVYVDTSSSNSWLATQPAPLALKDVFARALGVFGPKRILFGTDSNTFPSGWRRDRYDEQQAALSAIGASVEVQAAIFAENARRLLARA
ncbi:MAG: amidohydrolase [Planctomycetes bacterium]|nr:amidohydrolase [Planctomycetota bacterium]